MIYLTNIIKESKMYKPFYKMSRESERIANISRGLTNYSYDNEGAGNLATRVINNAAHSANASVAEHMIKQGELAGKAAADAASSAAHTATNATETATKTATDNATNATAKTAENVANESGYAATKAEYLNKMANNYIANLKKDTNTRDAILNANSYSKLDGAIRVKLDNLANKDGFKGEELFKSIRNNLNAAKKRTEEFGKAKDKFNKLDAANKTEAKGMFGGTKTKQVISDADLNTIPGMREALSAGNFKDIAQFRKALNSSTEFDPAIANSVNKLLENYIKVGKDAAPEVQAEINKNIFSAFSGGIVRFLKGVGSAIGGGVSKLGAGIRQTGRNIGKGVSEGIGRLKGNVEQLGESLKNGDTKAATETMEALANSAKEEGKDSDSWKIYVAIAGGLIGVGGTVYGLTKSSNSNE